MEIRVRALQTQRLRARVVCKAPLQRQKSGASNQKATMMLDVLMLAIGLGFFALAIGYGVVCDRL